MVIKLGRARRFAPLTLLTHAIDTITLRMAPLANKPRSKEQQRFAAQRERARRCRKSRKATVTRRLIKRPLLCFRGAVTPRNGGTLGCVDDRPLCASLLPSTHGIATRGREKSNAIRKFSDVDDR